MMVPVRCFSCGKPVSAIYEEYKRRTSEGEEAKAVLDDLKVERYCCRKTIFSHVDLLDEILPFTI